MTPRVLVIDDHELVRQGVRAVVEAQPGWTVAGECGGGAPALALALSLQPDVVVLDPLPDRDPGLETLRRIRAGLPAAEVVALAGDESEALLREALAAGARAVVLKSEPGQQLVAAIEAAARHEPFFSPRVSALLVEGYLRPREAGAAEAVAAVGIGGAPAEERGPAFPLTPREREIVQLVAAGRTSKEVASRLGLSVKTVEAHRANVMRKLGLHSVADLVRYAVRHHLVEL